MKKRPVVWIGLLLAFVLVGLLVRVVLISKPKARAGPLIVMRESSDAQAALQRRVVDELKPGNLADERAHNLDVAAPTAGIFKGRNWRGSHTGYLKLRMKVLPDEPMILNCSYWGSEEGYREFDVIVEGRIIAKQVLEYNVPGHFFDVEYEIPEELTRGRTEVAIDFAAYPGKGIGGFFGIATLKK